MGLYYTDVLSSILGTNTEPPPPPGPPRTGALEIEELEEYVQLGGVEADAQRGEGLGEGGPVGGGPLATEGMGQRLLGGGDFLSPLRYQKFFLFS